MRMQHVGTVGIDVELPATGNEDRSGAAFHQSGPIQLRASPDAIGVEDRDVFPDLAPGQKDVAAAGGDRPARLRLLGEPERPSATDGDDASIDQLDAGLRELVAIGLSVHAVESLAELHQIAASD